MNAGIVIIGAGGHAVSVANVALSCGYAVVAFIDDNKAGQTLLGVKIESSCKINDYEDYYFAIAVGDNNVREKVVNEYLKKIPLSNFPSLIHRSASIGVATSIGAGTVVMPNANVGPNSKVGEFVIINTGASIDHDCSLANFSSLAPRVVTGGNVLVGDRSALSIGATVKHGIKVGDDVVIGANSYVNKPFSDCILAYGNPCKFIRNRCKGESYLS